MKNKITISLDKNLLSILKYKANAQNKCLEEYLEKLIYDVSYLPNDETVKAIKDTRNGHNLEVIKDVDSFMKSL